MPSWYLLLVIGVMVVLLLAVNVYMLVHWSHPDDRNEAYFPKALVVSCWLFVLIDTYMCTRTGLGWVGLNSILKQMQSVGRRVTPWPVGLPPFGRAWIISIPDWLISCSHNIPQVLGLLLAEACVLAVPLDVANNSSNIGCQQGWVTACGACVCALLFSVLLWLGSTGPICPTPPQTRPDMTITPVSHPTPTHAPNQAG
jgi:hypothetical protein